jgi:hypothetical protein
MSANQNQEFQYYERVKLLFKVEPDCQVTVNKARILSNLVINHIDEEILQKVLKIKSYHNRLGKKYINIQLNYGIFIQLLKMVILLMKKILIIIF